MLILGGIHGGAVNSAFQNLVPDELKAPLLIVLVIAVIFAAIFQSNK